MSDEAGWLVTGSTSPDEVRSYYDQLASDYDATLAGWGYSAPEVAVGLLASRVNGGETLTMLDAGCGTGLAGAALRTSGFSGHLIGVDLSSASLDRAAERGVYDDLSVADLQHRLAFADDSVDAVLCVGVLTYVPDVEAIWRELCRVTRPGGIVVCTQRHDLWVERDCSSVLHALEVAGVWTVAQLTPPAAYLPGNVDFGDEILVRYLVARVSRRPDDRARGSAAGPG